MESTSIESVLRKIGFGSVQIQLIVIGGLILLAALNDTLGTSFVLPASQCDLELTTSDKGFLSGMTFLGVTVSSYFWGFLGDTQGRKWVISNALLLSSFFSVASAFINNFPLFVTCRFMVGVFVSGYSTTMYAYIGEFNTDRNRTATISWITVAIGLANIFIPMSAMWILSYDWSFELYSGYFFRPWRLLMIVYTLPGVIAALWLTTFRESPRFLLMRNQHDKAVDVMNWICRTNTGKANSKTMAITILQPEVTEVPGAKAITNNKNKCDLFKSMVSQTLPLLKPPHFIHVAICSLLHFGTFAISNGVGVFVPDVLNKLSNAGNATKICDVLQIRKIELNVTTTGGGDRLCDDSIEQKVFIDTAMLGLFYTVAFAVLAVVVKFIRRKRVLNFTLLMSFLAGFFLVNLDQPILILAAYFSFVIFAGINVSVINSAACDAIPTNLRAMAVCIAMLFGRLGSVITSNMIGNFIEIYCELTYYSLASLVLVCLIISFFLP